LRLNCWGDRAGPDGTGGTSKDRAGACFKSTRLENWKAEGLNHADLAGAERLRTGDVCHEHYVD